LVLVHPTSLVFVAIVGLWAAYLLPQWIRRRDALGASRTTDRHSLALRVLQRRRRERRPSPSTAPLIPRQLRTPPAPVPAPVTTRDAVPASAVARRRRTVLTALLGVTALCFVGAVAGAVPALVALMPGALLAADVAALRAVALRERRRGPAQPMRTARGAVPGGPRVAEAAAEPVLEPAPIDQPVPEPIVASAPVVAEMDADDGSWTPIPVPPPTYTLKPMAPRPEPAPLPTPAQPQLAPAARARAWVLEEPADLDLDDVLERRRAVNG
jgi:type II secretory pathway pseudopilin PulG